MSKLRGVEVLYTVAVFVVFTSFFHNVIAAESGGAETSLKIPSVKIEGISDKIFSDAFAVIEKCKLQGNPKQNFPRPFFSPGGRYAKSWWECDSSLILGAYKWADWNFAQDSLLNFETAMRADGRVPHCGYINRINIPIFGADGKFKYKIGADGKVLEYNGNPQCETAYLELDKCTQMPKLFDIAAGIVRGTSDDKYAERIYNLLKNYFGWWCANRYDAKTGLFWAVFEETFRPTPHRFDPKKKTIDPTEAGYAAVDTNMELARACECLAEMAKRLGKAEDEKKYLAKKSVILSAVEKHLWNETRGAYFSFWLGDGKFDDVLSATTFIAMRFGSAAPARKEKLLKLMTDPSEFNWGVRPLTSVSMKDAVFTEKRGTYFPSAWDGSVWTFHNEAVVRALADAGERELSAELAYSTVKTFADAGFCEFVSPSDGAANGVRDYGWSAAQCVQLVIERLFGIDIDMRARRIFIRPNFPKSLKGTAASIDNLQLPGDMKLSVNVDISDSVGITAELTTPNGKSTVTGVDSLEISF